MPVHRNMTWTYLILHTNVFQRTADFCQVVSQNINRDLGDLSCSLYTKPKNWTKRCSYELASIYLTTESTPWKPFWLEVVIYSEELCCLISYSRTNLNRTMNLKQRLLCLRLLGIERTTLCLPIWTFALLQWEPSVLLMYIALNFLKTKNPYPKILIFDLFEKTDSARGIKYFWVHSKQSRTNKLQNCTRNQPQQVGKMSDIGWTQLLNTWPCDSVFM